MPPSRLVRELATARTALGKAAARLAVPTRRRAVGATRVRGEEGAVAVEFALVLPILLLLVFGTVQYGLYFWAVQGGSAASREAARMAAVGRPTSCAEFRDRIADDIDAMERGGVSIKREYSSSGTVSVGDDVTVTVAFDTIDLNLPLVPFLQDGRVTETATARVEYVPDDTIGDCT